MRTRVLLASLSFALPLGAQTFFPAPPVPSGNRITGAKTLLGMALFWEEQLSSSSTVACGTCHSFAKGGSDPRVARHPGFDGVFGTDDDVHASPGVRLRDTQGRLEPAAAFGLDPQVTPRKAPSVLNAAYSSKLFYDGRAADGVFRDPQTGQVVMTGAVALENLSLQPILNPVEMGHPGRTWNEVVDKIRNARPLVLASDLPSRLGAFVQDRSYPQMFEEAFGSTDVTAARIGMALATYMRTLVSDETPFDRHVAGLQAMEPEAVRGFVRFNQGGAIGAAAACSRCHGDISARSHQVGPRFETTTPYGTVVGHNNFHNTGVRPLVEDPGRAGITGNAVDEGRFKVPLLRNVALRGPFFHNGGMASLEEVVDFYARGGDFHVNQAVEIRPRNLSAQDKSDLVAFLNALTDPRVAQELPPFDRPVLTGDRGDNSVPFTYGTGMVSATGERVRSVVDGAALLAQDHELAVSGVEPGQPAFIVWDVMLRRRDFFMFGLRLRVMLSPWGSVVPAGSSTSAEGVGYARTRLSIPSAPSILGLDTYGQWVIGDSSSQVGLVTSDAFLLTVR